MPAADTGVAPPALDVILAIDAVRYPLTGVGRYVYELARHLPECEGVARLRYFAGSQFVEALPRPNVGAGSLQGLRRQLLKSRLAVAAFRSVGAVRNRLALRGEHTALFHGPGFYLPPHAGPSIATIHDLSIFRWPECHPPERVRFMKREIELTLRRADALITDSEYTRREIAEFFGWPLQRIHAVPLASSQEFGRRDAGELAQRLAPLGVVPDGYTLFSGTLEPRKNLSLLMAAYAELPVTHRRRWPLVLCGYSGWRNAEIRDAIARGEQEGWVRYLGYVAAEELPLLFAGARLFAFPSLYEGFGLPVLEAMASGVPVVCSDAGSLPEVAGDAALLVNPCDQAGLTRALQQGLEDDAWRSQAVARGELQAARFSWQRCAEETAAVYRTVLVR